MAKPSWNKDLGSYAELSLLSFSDYDRFDDALYPLYEHPELIGIPFDCPHDQSNTDNPDPNLILMPTAGVQHLREAGHVFQETVIVQPVQGAVHAPSAGQTLADLLALPSCAAAPGGSIPAHS